MIKLSLNQWVPQKAKPSLSLWPPQKMSENQWLLQMTSLSK
uniref:Uncharacterized protein n=1 Tax=Anguilla anguilla TaxID=7936 RepID=A0A0E9RKK0_ANGAN